MRRRSVDAGILWLLSACAPQPAPSGPAPVQDRYEVSFSIQGEPRRALVHAAAAGGPAPAVIYFHGRGGTAEASERHIPFHQVWPEAYVVYAEGTNFDHRPEPANGWQIRFPQVSQYCKLDKDLEYVDQLLGHLRATGRVDPDRIFVAGHSSGAFFTLSLMELRPERFRAFAAVGSYARPRARLEPRICEDVYHGVGIPLREGDRAATPRPVLYVFGTRDTMFDGNTPGYAADCARPSKARDTLLSLLIRNGCPPPKCEPGLSFMADRARQVYAPSDLQAGAPVALQLYEGGHSWPRETTGWVVDFFRGWSKR
jgi:poly(3-hydroxybutyrate) depolymerase